MRFQKLYISNEEFKLDIFYKILMLDNVLTIIKLLIMKTQQNLKTYTSSCSVTIRLK